MARDFPIGNGNLLVNFDQSYNIRDLYFPYVGQENHGLDHLSHFGVWTADGFAWIDDAEFRKDVDYEPDTLITRGVFTHERLGLELTLQDAVDAQKNVLLRRIAVRNMRPEEREIKLYQHLDLHLYGNSIGDTVYFEPDLHSLFFYKGHRYVSLSCCPEGSGEPAPTGYACGQKELHGLQGTWKDAEDGRLEGNPIAQGSVDGTVELAVKIPANEERAVWFWCGFANSREELFTLEGEVRKSTPQVLLKRTRKYWTDWVRSDRHDLSELPADVAKLYKRSLLTIRTNMDNRGAIIAANDSDILKFAKDTYSYMWPRDGALIAHALDRSGYHELTRRFFDFCKKGMAPEGFQYHKYNPDGSVGSSWHPWVNPQGLKQLPIQEDETALVVYALWHHHVQADTLADSADDYQNFVVPAADFLCHYRDVTGLPQPSYDLWEERYGVMAFTVSAVYAGLKAAVRFAEYHGDKARAEYYAEVTERVRKAAEEQLVAPQLNRFVRGLYWNEDARQYEPDLTLDASMYGVFDFGLAAADDPRVVQLMRDMRQRLWVQTDIGGMARYENDYYHQVSQDIGRVAGNPWFICTLWYAEWIIAVAKTKEDLQEAKDLLQWCVRHALKSGIMAEQVHPYTGAPLSVSPLTWSHSSFVKVVQEYVAKLGSFNKKPKREQDVSDERILQGASR